MPTNASSTSNDYLTKIRAQIPCALSETHLETSDLPVSNKTVGKVRDSYTVGDNILLVTTDRLSAFDRSLALIPYKGQVLNLISAWWFEQTADLVPNHLVSVPDPNAIIAKKCSVFPIEFVMRGYITGTTDTSLWTQYQKGVRHYCGQSFPEGLKKNQKLEQAVLTPTTKEKEHDRPISAEEIISEGWMSQEHWKKASELAKTLYKRGVEIAAKHGLILVDTKYEFGVDDNGNVLVVDEIHTPDSSRYWLADSYQQRISEGMEPENIDKEFLRLWFAKHCDPYKDKQLPEAPQELVEQLASRYIQLYEMITGQSFQFSDQETPLEQRLVKNLSEYLR